MYFSGSGSMLLLGSALRIHRLSRCLFRGRENVFGSVLRLGAALRIRRLSTCVFRGWTNKRIWEYAPSRSCLEEHRLSRCIFWGHRLCRCIWEHAPSRSCLENSLISRCIFWGRENASRSMLLLSCLDNPNSGCIFRDRENASPTPEASVGTKGA